MREVGSRPSLSTTIEAGIACFFHLENIMFDYLTKQDILKEYGHSFYGVYKLQTCDVFEKFGDADPLNPRDIEDAEAALDMSIKDGIDIKEQMIARYQAGYDIYKQAWFARPFLFMFMKSAKLSIEMYKSQIEDIKKTAKVVYLKDMSYRIPKVRFHSGDTVFIGTIRGDVVKISEANIKHTFIGESEGKLSLIYRVEHQTEEGISRFTYDVKNERFETDSGQSFVSHSRDEVFNALEKLIDKKIKRLQQEIAKVK